MFVQDLAILVACDTKQFPYPARQHGVQVAPEGAQVIAQPFGQRRGGGSMGLDRPAVQRIVGFVGRPLLARRAGLREEVLVDAVDQQPDRRFRVAHLAFCRGHRPPHVLREQVVSRMAHRTSSQESGEPTLDSAQRRDQPCDGISGDALGGQLSWRWPHGTVEDRAGHQAAVEQPGQTGPQLQIAQFGKHHRDGRVFSSDRAANAQSAIECLVGQPQRLGLVGHPKARIEPGLEGELAQQRQAEGVDRADRDLRQVLSQHLPPARIDAALFGRAFERRQNPLPHLGRRLAGEGDRQDVPRLDASAYQVDIAIHQHARLARARRGLEDDVQARIDRIGAIGGVGEERRRVHGAGGRGLRRVVKWQPRVRRHPRSPCGRRPQTHSSGRET